MFRDTSERRRTIGVMTELSTLLERVRSARRHDDAIELLIVAGQLESAVLDAMQPEEDAPGHARAALDSLSRAAGRLAACSWTGGAVELPIGDVAVALRWLREQRLPREIEVKTPEGYAWYGVHPEAWLEAARQVGAPGGRVVVIGLRSIGTSLSAMAAAAFESSRVMRWVIRPRGHPFDRRPALSPEVLEALRQHRADTFLIVDEGPGLSGSSMTGVAEAVSALGVPDARIVLMPAWVPDPTRFASARARENWGRWRTVVVPFESLGVLERLQSRYGALKNWSAGAWRVDLLAEAEWPAVQPQHERRKWRSAEHVIRFIGLGGQGRTLAERIHRMHEAGFGPELSEVDQGYAALRFVEGQNLAPLGSELASTLARYLEWLSTETTERPIDFDALAEMIEVNVREGLGLPPPSCARSRAAIEGAQPVRIDGRLHLHEWVRTRSGWVKIDGFDHHADHFFPGGQDLAWDLAGIAAEHSLALRSEVLERLGPSLVQAERIRFYDVAYGAARLGYARMAAEATQGAEQDRWRREEARYGSFLRGALERFK